MTLAVMPVWGSDGRSALKKRPGLSLPPRDKFPSTPSQPGDGVKASGLPVT